ncbi:class I SAM-dependent methyltransferase [Enterococcus xiangfangensis]|uniref:methyltransferase domain-containing protein n=1 Tax=Enterococcus xiangfangensis TaxID=1296537 RepID=UPI0010F90634|nr:class I SAM-dependent methyltransferase [Enterococcus xiangfangensis]MBM7710821.1 SAM-dependent methyltransferase [Enterococcus xiangfangensis]NBK08265.1 methyltransferase domain-containing protein [Enterococcus asini]
MSDYLSELESFWDEFAEDYEAIQQESTLPIAQDLREFLFTQKLLPCHTFLDLAGGTGRYIPALQTAVKEYDLVDISEKMLQIAAAKSAEHVRLIKQAQEPFLAQNKHRYDLVFSAMNPALQSQSDLLAFYHTSRNWCLLLRVVKDEDQLFSPYEETNPDLSLNERYKSFLAELHIPFQTKKFSYTSYEMISRDFFQAYFADTFTPAELVPITQKIFGATHEKLNQSMIEFELIYFQVVK